MPEPMTMVAVGSGMVGLLGHLSRRYFDRAKEVVDVVCGFVALLISLPIMAVCMIIIKCSSRGPAMFVQQRVGKNGRLFRMYKLRTMYTGAESASGAVWAQRNDPRVISACGWMRRSHMDELPQLLNVIKGDMSLVGPRPERPEILDKLAEVYPDVGKRLVVRPGITGLAQVTNGYDTSVDSFRNKLSADLKYIERRRWSTELRIMAATITKLNDRTSH